MRLLSPRECAERKGVSPQAVHHAIRNGTLAATRVGRAWVVQEEACDAWSPNVNRLAGGRKSAANRAKNAQEAGPKENAGATDEPRELNGDIPEWIGKETFEEEEAG